jgi:hypothetical protein
MQMHQDCAGRRRALLNLQSLQEDTMRSDLVFAAMAHVPNRFLLSRVVAKATRKFHRPNTRIEETANGVFMRLGRARLIPAAQAESNVQPLRRTEMTRSRQTDQTQAVA